MSGYIFATSMGVKYGMEEGTFGHFASFAIIYPSVPSSMPNFTPIEVAKI